MISSVSDLVPEENLPMFSLTVFMVWTLKISNPLNHAEEACNFSLQCIPPNRTQTHNSGIKHGWKDTTLIAHSQRRRPVTTIAGQKIKSLTFGTALASSHINGGLLDTPFILFNFLFFSPAVPLIVLLYSLDLLFFCTCHMCCVSSIDVGGESE
jgi:hypothetical protein